jgi:beta-glucosidase
MLGVNYYTPSRIRASSPELAATAVGLPSAGRWVDDPGDHAAAARPVPWPGTDLAWSVPQPGPYTDMGWRIEPSAFRDLLVRTARAYPSIPLMVTENGACYPDGPDPVDGRVRDARRVDYLHSHLGAVLDAIDLGADIRGYYVWSLLDNFEWALGYAKRFGIVHVDYETLARTPKDSFHWYAALARSGSLLPGG